jgi:nucleoside 2-deoxyribosyltransferase
VPRATSKPTSPANPAAPPAVYVASPLGFSEIGRRYNTEVIIPQLRKLGYDVLDPWAEEVSRRLEAARALPHEHEQMSALGRINMELGERNARLLAKSEAVLALLDGTDVDSGVASEIGYACALKRPVVAWRSDLRRAGENEGTPVNLQVAYFVSISGGRLTSSFAEALETLCELMPVPPAS